MSFQVHSYDSLPHEKWTALSSNSILSSPEFASIWNVRGGEPVFLCLEKNDILTIGMAGMLFGSKFFRRFESMPDGLYGGVFTDESCTDEDRVRFIDGLLKFLRDNRIVRADIHGSSMPFDKYGFKRYESYSHILDIPEDGYVPPHRNIREHLRKANREENITAVFDNPERLSEFYELVRMTEKRPDIQLAEFFR